MHVIVIYDVQAGRTDLFKRYLRQRLTHLQHSVFEGELSEGKVDDIEEWVAEEVEEGEGESVVVYRVASEKYLDREAFGEDPGDDSELIF